MPAAAASERHAGDELGHQQEHADCANDGSESTGAGAVVAPPPDCLAESDDSGEDGGMREQDREYEERDPVEAGDGSQVVSQDPCEGIHSPPAVCHEVHESMPGVDQRSADRPEHVLITSDSREDHHGNVEYSPGYEELGGHHFRRFNRVQDYAPESAREEAQYGPGQPERQAEYHPLEPVRPEDEGVEQARSVVTAVRSGVAVGGDGGCVSSRNRS